MSNAPHVTAVFDLDGTITCNDTYLSFLLTYLKFNPHRLVYCWSLPFVVAIFKLGFKDNTWVKKKFLSAVLGGKSQCDLEKFAGYFIKMILEQKVKKNAIKEIQLHKKLNHKLILATASFDFYVCKLGEQLGFDAVICTHSLWDKDNKLIGDIDGYNCYGKYKLEKVSQYLKESRDKTHIILYTDHHSDQPLMDWVDEAIAINPTNKMRDIAILHKFEIRDW